MVVVPAATPFTAPLVASIVAVAVLVLLHVPPVVVLAKVIVAASHTVVAPEIAVNDGAAITVSG